MFVTFFLAVTHVAVMQNGTVILIFGEEMNMKRNVCWAYRKIEPLCLYNEQDYFI